MPLETDRHLVIARLRAEIRRLERAPGRRDGRVASGVAAVDGVVPGGGFPRGALSELSGGPASGKTEVALALVAALGPRDLAAWVDGRGELYPPAAAARGVDLARLLVVRPSAPLAGTPATLDAVRPGLWAAEALLASGAFAAVIVDLPVPARVPGADAVGRRLQAAAERGGAVGLWLASGRGLRVPAAVRLELSAARSAGTIVARLATGGAPGGGGGTHRAA